MCDLLTTNLATKLKFLPIGGLYFVLLVKSFPAEKLKIRGRSWAMKDQFNSIQPKLYTTQNKDTVITAWEKNFTTVLICI